MKTPAKISWALLLLALIAGCGANPSDGSGDAAPSGDAADAVVNPLADAAEIVDKTDGAADAQGSDNVSADAEPGLGELDATKQGGADSEKDSESLLSDGDDGSDAIGATDGDTTADTSGATDGDATGDATSLPAGPSPSECDAGDLNWSRRAIAAILGRKPMGLAEAQAMTDLAAIAGRKVAAQILMQYPEFTTHWAHWLTDELAVNRTGYKRQKPCFDAPLLPKVDTQLAIFVRDHQPDADKFVTPFRQIDLLKSALLLDDLSPLYRAHLFPLVAHPLTQCDNPTIEELDLERRADVAKVMRMTFLHRDIGCTNCHNSHFGVSFDPDPAKNEHWPLPGRVEKALFGSEIISAELEVQLNALTRYYGVATGAMAIPFSNYSKIAGTPVHPWNLDLDCGEFAGPKDVSVDINGLFGVAYWGSPQTTKTTVWKLETSLHAGVDILRKNGKASFTSQNEMNTDEAFAYAWSTRVTHQIWLEMMGHPLSLDHGFSRNLAQHDAWYALTQTFIAHGFSLKEVQLAIVLNPLFNQRPLDEACLGKDSYVLPAIFDPYSSTSLNIAQHNNSVGDALHRSSPRTLLRIAEQALQWVPLRNFPSREQSGLQKALGLFLSDDAPGFRGVNHGALLAWEAYFGTCTQPPLPPPASPGSIKSLADKTCKDRCNEDDAVPGGCWCDALCSTVGDCCLDVSQFCNGKLTSAGPAPADWIDTLFGVVKTYNAAQPNKPATLRQVIAALKDRLLTEPEMNPKEVAAVQTFFGGQSLDLPFDVTASSDTLRTYCGVLLKSPQFTLLGMARPQQKILPTLLVPGQGYAEQCLALQPLALAVGWQIDCAASTLTAKKSP